MEQIWSNLPPLALPQGKDVCSQAVRSVYARGFYDKTPVVADNPQVMAQFLRLVEEIGELVMASATMKYDLVAEESADVVIVISQLAWLYGLSLERLLVPCEVECVASLSVLLSELSRAMRRSERDGVHLLLRRMVIHVRQTARIHEIDIEQAIWRKLAKDERRGVRHGEER